VSAEHLADGLVDGQHACWAGILPTIGLGPIAHRDPAVLPERSMRCADSVGAGICKTVFTDGVCNRCVSGALKKSNLE
jgi:hypothetical protein